MSAQVEWEEILSVTIRSHGDLKGCTHLQRNYLWKYSSTLIWALFSSVFEMEDCFLQKLCEQFYWSTTYILYTSYEVCNSKIFNTTTDGCNTYQSIKNIFIILKRNSTITFGQIKYLMKIFYMKWWTWSCCGKEQMGPPEMYLHILLSLCHQPFQRLVQLYQRQLENHWWISKSLLIPYVLSE